MSQHQEKKITIERRAQLQSFIVTDERSNTSQPQSTSQTNIQCDSQVLSFLDSITAFIKSTFLGSKSSFALLFILVIYFFSNWSITLSNRKGFSIDFIDILFIIVFGFFVKAWITGEGFDSIFELISGRTQQVIGFAQKGFATQTQASQSQQNSGLQQARSSVYQQISKFGSESFYNVRKTETVEQLYERYMQEKFQLCEQNFLDCEIVQKLPQESEQKLEYLISEYQKQFGNELPFTIKDIDFNQLPSDITSEDDFRQRILNAHHLSVIEYVKYRFGFDYNLQNPMLQTQSNPKKQNNQPDSLPSLVSDLLKIERDLLINRSLPIFAYSNAKQNQINARFSSFLNEDTLSKVEQFNKKIGSDDSFSENIVVVLGNSERKEVELKKFVNDPSERKEGNLESLILADKLIERQVELNKQVKSFKKTAKKHMIDQAKQSHASLTGLIDSFEQQEEQNQEGQVSDSEEQIKKIDAILSAQIDAIVKDSSCVEFNANVFDPYLDNAQEQQMKSESSAQMNQPNRQSIYNILQNELNMIISEPNSSSVIEPTIPKYLELITKFEYFVDQYKDDNGYLDQIKESLDKYFQVTLKNAHTEKQKKRLRNQLNKFKESQLQAYLLRSYKKQLANIAIQSEDCKKQLTQLQEQTDLKERKVGLLEDQVTSLQDKLKEIRERLGTVEIAYEEEKNALIRDVDNKKKKIDELFAQINNVQQVSSEKEIKEEKKESVNSPKNQVDPAEEMQLRKVTSYQASISILEKSVRGITEVFYDKFRNTAYFNQQDMIDQLKKKFGDDILNGNELTQDQRDFVIKQFEDKFADAEDHFLNKNLGGENESDNTQKNQQNKKSIMNSLDKNFDILKQRLNKARDISDIQQVKMTSEQDERDANRIIDDVINGALTDSDETYNRQLIALKKIMLKYKQAPGNTRTSIDLTKSQKQSSVAAPHQRVRQKIETTIQYIQENMQNIKGQMKNYLSEDMRRTLKSKIAEWKRSQEDKKEVMSKWNLQSQNMWFTLIWHDGNDLDLVVKCPCGQKIYYGTKKCESCGTYLEIDMNAGGNKNDKFPVEHIYLQKQPKLGSQWEVYCKMFHCNNNKDSPFTIQIEHEDGRIVSYQGTLDINENPQSPIYKYTVDKGIDEKEKNLILKIRKVIDEQEEYVF